VPPLAPSPAGLPGAGRSPPGTPRIRHVHRRWINQGQGSRPASERSSRSRSTAASAPRRPGPTGRRSVRPPPLRFRGPRRRPCWRRPPRPWPAARRWA
jgi:hypothetical protein